MQIDYESDSRTRKVLYYGVQTENFTPPRFRHLATLLSSYISGSRFTEETREISTSYDFSGSGIELRHLAMLDGSCAIILVAEKARSSKERNILGDIANRVNNLKRGKQEEQIIEEEPQIVFGLD